MDMNPFKNLIDHIFSLPLGILNTINGKLDALSQITGQGLDISRWLSPIGLLGPAWVKVVNSLLAGATIVLTVWLVKRVYNIYLQFKEGVKFW
jgi:hypothetical protein